MYFNVFLVGHVKGETNKAGYVELIFYVFLYFWLPCVRVICY